MVRPARFESNPLTAGSNVFQGRCDRTPEEQQIAALAEFDALVEALRAAGIDVIVVDDTPDPHTPDSIFPNNWVSFHADGRVVLYPMEAENRRTERQLDVIDRLSDELAYQITDIVDLSEHETVGHFLEGTGSMVLDRVNRIAYACLSTRTQLDPLGDFAQRMDYDVVAFDALDRHGVPIYHTNVMMSVGEKLAIICDAAIASHQRAAVLARLHDSGHDSVRLNFNQLEAFAGNMLELRNNKNRRVFAMSSRAWNSLNDSQQRTFEENGDVLNVNIDTIENSAGGSVRCMLAEVHLPT